ncbi:polyketide synthase [Fusarium heterosporum]|uniref:Polyketide synthase n=1 Tax=Fusarium heterosporum TaxID=42747 RepID=A0A8H5SRP5_FUSHE|nr:polyketide synthase [Fusarium heterosporum]
MTSDAVFSTAGYITMAVEAAKRLYQESPASATITGFFLWKVDAKATLRVPKDDTEIEFILSTDLSSNAKSLEWTRFTIVSVTRDSSHWIEHCTGQAKVEVGLNTKVNIINTETDARITGISAWYSRFAEIGIGYRSEFQVHADQPLKEEIQITPSIISPWTPFSSWVWFYATVVS